MAREVERFITIENLAKVAGKAERQWRSIPNGFHVRVWEMSTADALLDEIEVGYPNKRLIFHIAFMPGVVRGCRVSYMSEHFNVLGVSDSTRLRGLELRCAPLV
jgi:hypothetical protein